VCVQSFVAGGVLLPFALPSAGALGTLGGANLARFGYLLLAGSTAGAAAPGLRAAHAARRPHGAACSRSSRCSRWCSR
jgi:hypothetical protein